MKFVDTLSKQSSLVDLCANESNTNKVIDYTFDDTFLNAFDAVSPDKIIKSNLI